MKPANIQINQLAESGPLAMRGIIQAVNQGTDVSPENGLEIEKKQFFDLCKSGDMLEGTTAFLKKRKAVFKGT